MLNYFLLVTKLIILVVGEALSSFNITCFMSIFLLRPLKSFVDAGLGTFIIILFIIAFFNAFNIAGFSIIIIFALFLV